MSFKNITIKMKSGKSRTQRVKVLASGKYRFVKNIKSNPKTKSKSSSPKSKKKTGKAKKEMAKKKRRNNSMTIPLAPIAGLFGGFAARGFHPSSPIENLLQGKFDRVAVGLCTNYTGFNPDDGTFNILSAVGIPPLIVGALIHKFVGGAPLNLNRVLARAKVPFIRL